MKGILLEASTATTLILLQIFHYVLFGVQYLSNFKILILYTPYSLKASRKPVYTYFAICVLSSYSVYALF